MTKLALKQLQITLVRSPIASLKRHKACVSGLGLRRLHHTVVVDDTPAIRGMIKQVQHLVLQKEI
jgi:large subunit ribosomal protein L30